MSVVLVGLAKAKDAVGRTCAAVADEAEEVAIVRREDDAVLLVEGHERLLRQHRVEKVAVRGRAEGLLACWILLAEAIERERHAPHGERRAPATAT